MVFCVVVLVSFLCCLSKLCVLAEHDLKSETVVVNTSHGDVRGTIASSFDGFTFGHRCRVHRQEARWWRNCYLSDDERPPGTSAGEEYFVAGGSVSCLFRSDRLARERRKKHREVRQGQLDQAKFTRSDWKTSSPKPRKRRPCSGPSARRPWMMPLLPVP